MSRIPWPIMYTSCWCVFDHKEHIYKANNSQGKRKKKEHLCKVLFLNFKHPIFSTEDAEIRTVGNGPAIGDGETY